MSVFSRGRRGGSQRRARVSTTQTAGTAAEWYAQACDSRHTTWWNSRRSGFPSFPSFPSFLRFPLFSLFYFSFIELIRIVSVVGDAALFGSYSVAVEGNA